MHDPNAQTLNNTQLVTSMLKNAAVTLPVVTLVPKPRPKNALEDAEYEIVKRPQNAWEHILFADDD